MSPAHKEIFGAKFLSFERLGLWRLYTVGYMVCWRNNGSYAWLDKLFSIAKEPL